MLICLVNKRHINMTRMPIYNKETLLYYIYRLSIALKNGL
jgi:hypothetical protein